MEKETKHPDFNEWLKTPDGLSSNDINTLADQKYLTNRLFWAFDAGRNCVWDQYLEMKKEREELVKLMDDVRFVINITPEIKHQEPYVKLLSEMESLINRINKTTNG